MYRLLNRLQASAIVRHKNYRAALYTWWHTCIDRRPFIFTDRHGITLKVRPGDELRNLFFHQSHFDDSGLLIAADSLIKFGATVVDVGANYGQFSLFASTRVGPDGYVHAFEPASANWERLQENLVYNAAYSDRIISHRLALSDRSGRVNFYHYPENPAWNSLHPHKKWLNLEDRDRNAPTIMPKVVLKTDVTTLDCFIPKIKAGTINLLKIDVEGFELSVLQGAHSLLKRQQIESIIFEICPDLTAAVGHLPRTLIDYLVSLGYQCSKIESDGRLLQIGTDFDFPFLANYLAVLRA